MTRCSIINDFFVLNTFFFIMLFSWIHHEFFKRGNIGFFVCLFVWRKIITFKSDMIFCKIKRRKKGGRGGRVHFFFRHRGETYRDSSFGIMNVKIQNQKFGLFSSISGSYGANQFGWICANSPHDSTTASTF